MVGDAAANAAITWVSRDSFVPILFRRSKPLHGEMTCEGAVCGIADALDRPSEIRELQRSSASSEDMPGVRTCRVSECDSVRMALRVPRIRAIYAASVVQVPGLNL